MCSHGGIIRVELRLGLNVISFCNTSTSHGIKGVVGPWATMIEFWILVWTGSWPVHWQHASTTLTVLSPCPWSRDWSESTQYCASVQWRWVKVRGDQPKSLGAWGWHCSAGMLDLFVGGGVSAVVHNTTMRDCFEVSTFLNTKYLINALNVSELKGLNGVKGEGIKWVDYHI